MYNGNINGFADRFRAAVQGVTPIPIGTKPNVYHDWSGSTIDGLCQHFINWFSFRPEGNSGLWYIQKFSWLYYENEFGLRFVTTEPGLGMTKAFVNLFAQYMNSDASQELVETWETQIGPEGMSKFKKSTSKTSTGYQNFNDFFARELIVPRPISSPTDASIVVAPADAIVNMIADELTVDTLLPVKTQQLRVDQLLNNSPYAQKFIGGTAVSCILMPTVYHRYHAPVSGTVVESNEDVTGGYFGINDFPELLDKGNVGYGYDYSVFEHFRRGYLIIDTELYGLVAMVPVGLNTISSVIFQDKFKNIGPSTTPKVAITKGDDVGHFAYGGSLNILLFEKGQFPSLRIPQGQVIGHFEPPPSAASAAVDQKVAKRDLKRARKS